MGTEWGNREGPVQIHTGHRAAVWVAVDDGFGSPDSRAIPDEVDIVGRAATSLVHDAVCRRERCGRLGSVHVHVDVYVHECKEDAAGSWMPQPPCPDSTSEDRR